MDIKKKRKYVMDYVTKMYDLLDPSGSNSKSFKEKYEKLNDAQFSKEFEKFLNSESQKGFYLEVVEYERDLTLDNIFKCADALNIPLFEMVAVPHINGDDDNIMITPTPVPVGKIHMKRQQQTLLKKNSSSIYIDNRNPRTGLAKDDDKNASNSNVETYAMTVLGADKALQEMMGPRADNLKAKSEMYNSIEKNGFVSLDELSNEQRDKVAINSLDAYFTMQGLRTNLVFNPDFIPGLQDN